MHEMQDYVNALLFNFTGYLPAQYPQVEPVEPAPHPLKDADVIYSQRQLDTDIYLGKYIAASRKIELYPTNIGVVADHIGCEPKDLKLVVLIHEWCHAIVHLGLEKEEWKEFSWYSQNLCGSQKADEILKKILRVYEGIESNLHEQIAQFLTYHALVRKRDSNVDEAAKNRADRLIATFTKLMQVQPRPYVIKLNTIPERGLLALNLIKREHLTGGQLQSWKEILDCR